MSAVPGTFKNRPDVLRRDLSSEGRSAEDLLLNAGALVAKSYTLGDCTVMVGREPLNGSHRWHLSIAHPSRYPSWDEIKTAVYSVADLGDAHMAQILGPVGVGEWVNAHDNCFHLYEIHDDAFTN